MVAVDREALLAADEAEALAHLEQEFFEAVDDGLLEISLVRRGAAMEIEKLQHEWILDDVAGCRDLEALGERANGIGGTVATEALVEQRANLSLELTHRPVLASRLDLVERARGIVTNAEEDQVVRPREPRRKWGSAEFAQRC